MGGSNFICLSHSSEVGLGAFQIGKTYGKTLKEMCLLMGQIIAQIHAIIYCKCSRGYEKAGIVLIHEKSFRNCELLYIC